MKVLIGVDPHKKSVNAVAAIDENGELVGHEVFPANRKGLQALERWSKRFARRRWAVEGAAGIGRPVAQKLVASGEEVVDVPPKLSAKVRVLSVGNARKNYRLDATFTTLAALSNERLTRVSSEKSASARIEVLRLLTERREDLVAERTRALRTACTCCCATCSQMASLRVFRQMLPPSFCVGLVPCMPWDERGSVWPPS
jgi:transposase